MTQQQQQKKIQSHRAVAFVMICLDLNLEHRHFYPTSPSPHVGSLLMQHTVYSYTVVMDFAHVYRYSF